MNVIINEKIKNIKHFKYTNDVDLFKKLIYKDILNGLNICVAAMSTGLIEEIYNYLIEKGIKVVLYTSKCSKEVRDELGRMRSESTSHFVRQYKYCLNL